MARGYLTAAGLDELIRSVVVDAFLVLTVPLAAESPMAAIRFISTRTYWSEMFPRARLDSVCGEVLSRARSGWRTRPVPDDERWRRGTSRRRPRS